jgi:Flp pilus assembly protein TadG
MRIMRRRDDRGASAVEFALISIPFIFLVFGMIQYGWYFYVSQSTGGAASNVVRQLQVGNCWGSGQALSRAKAQAPQITSVAKLPNQDTPPVAGTQLTVTVQADARLLSLVPMPDGGIVTKTVYARAEDDTAVSCP